MSDRGGYRRRKDDWTPSPAQARVLEALADGLTNAEIAVRLGLSPETVKWHISELLSLTGTSDREDLAQWWRRRHQRTTITPFLKRVFPLAGVAGLAGLAFLVLSPGQHGTASYTPPTVVDTPASAEVPKPWETAPISEAEWNACPSEKGEDGTENTGLKPVDPSDIATQGLLPIGRVIESQSCALLSVNRADRSFFRVPMSAKVMGADLTAIALRRVWHSEKPLTVGGVEVRLSIWSTGTTYIGAGAEFVVSALDASSRDHRTAVDREGNVWIDPRPVPDDLVVEAWTGDALDVSGAVRLARLQPGGRPEKFAQPVFYFSSCKDQEACSVSYRPFAPTLAPVAGIVSCPPAGQLWYDERGHPTGVIELNAGSFVLRFTELFTYSGNSKDSFSCATRQVVAGEPVGDHYHYDIEAFRPDGSPLSVAVSEDSTVFVGDIKHDVVCPCEPGN